MPKNRRKAKIHCNNEIKNLIRQVYRSFKKSSKKKYNNIISVIKGKAMRENFKMWFGMLKFTLQNQKFNDGKNN